jgi:hypothetical protein
MTFSGPSTARTVTLPDANFTAARTDAAQTFTGVQTFSSAPVIGTITNTGTLTLPTSTDTLVGRATTDTLTNKRITSRVVSNTSLATWAPASDTTDLYILTAQAAAVTAISNPTGTPTDGQRLTIRAKCDGTNRAISGWDTQYRASTDLPFPTTLTANKTMYLGFIYNAADTKWDLVAELDNF